MHPTFHPTLIFSMLDEILAAFGQGFTLPYAFSGSHIRHYRSSSRARAAADKAQI